MFLIALPGHAEPQPPEPEEDASQTGSLAARGWALRCPVMITAVVHHLSSRRDLVGDRLLSLSGAGE